MLLRFQELVPELNLHWFENNSYNDVQDFGIDGDFHFVELKDVLQLIKQFDMRSVQFFSRLGLT